jgi:class 3 adenylate cyclase
VGTGLQIKSLTVLFTDLQASTAMYERVGDLKALEIVRRHFEVLEGVVASHQGAVVKTIGDAVMAVFYEAGQAMRAATHMIDNVRRATGHGEDLVLKIGLHGGPCVAVQSNNQMDYFGRTVNIAARVQALANGGEIVCSEELWQVPGVMDALSGRGLTARKETARLKGIAERFPVRRVAVLTSAQPHAASRSARPARPVPRAALPKARPSHRPKAARPKARPPVAKGRRARVS